MLTSRCFLFQGAADILFKTVDPVYPILQIDCYFSLGDRISTVSTLSQVRIYFTSVLEYLYSVVLQCLKHPNFIYLEVLAL